jgi:hypothetical protein
MSEPQFQPETTTSQLVWAVKHRDLTAADAIAHIDRRIEAARAGGTAAERDRTGQLISIFTEELRAEGNFHWADRIAGLASLLAGDQP